MAPYYLQTLSSEPLFTTTVNVRKPNMFGFQTGAFCWVPNCFEQTKVSEIRTFCSDFRHKFVSEIRMFERFVPLG